MCNEAEKIMEKLPQGSGFDCNWEYIKTLKNGKVVFQSFYHVINNDMYDGFVKLRLTVDSVKEDFKLTLRDRKKYHVLIREYLEDTIYFHLFR